VETKQKAEGRRQKGRSKVARKKDITVISTDMILRTNAIYSRGTAMPCPYR
jgi:hypothetical protein